VELNHALKDLIAKLKVDKGVSPKSPKYSY